MAGTVVTYNGIVINDCLTKRFVEDVVRDESGADTIYHKFTVHVVGYVNGQTTDHGITAGAAGVPSSWTILRSALLSDRKTFFMTVDGVTILSAKSGALFSADKTVDVNGGPKPQYAEVVKVVGSNLLRVEFAIELALVDCQSGKASGGVLSNRWGMADEIDDAWHTTRTTTGRLRIDSAHRGTPQFRGLCIPQLSEGFKRQSQNFTVSPDGLTLDYSIVDKQEWAAPPFPAVKWSGTHTETTGQAGVTSFSEINISLTGGPNVNKQSLAATGMAIILNKMAIRGLKNDASYVLISAAMIDQMETSKIEVRVRVQRFPNAGAGSSIWTLTRFHWGTPIKVGAPRGLLGDQGGDVEINYNQKKFPVPSSTGTAPIVDAFISYLQTPCSNTHDINAAAKSAKKKKSQPKGDFPSTRVSTSPVPLPDESAPAYEPSHRSAIYTHYRIDNRFEFPRNRLQLPVGKASDQSDTVGTQDINQDTSVVIDLAPATSRRVAVIEAERTGDWPEIPAPVDLDEKTKIMDSILNIASPPLGPEGDKHKFYVKLTYVYATTNTPKVGEALKISKVPFIKFQPTSLPASAFTNKIL